MSSAPCPRPENPPPAADSGACGDAGMSEGLEEELWLYGAGSPTRQHEEETGSTPGPTKSCEQDVCSGSVEHKDDSLQITLSCSDNDDDSDTDSDDVKVTIGDIRTGVLASMGPTASQSVKGGRSYSATGKLPPKGIDFSAPGCINGLPVLEVDLDTFEEKPWRKPGADLSDYFNYGFNEATWKVYCEKQRRLQLGLETSYPHSKENKITVQQGRTGHTSKGEGNLFDSDLSFNIGEGKLVIEASQNGKQAKAIDVIGGEICSITRVEGRRWDIQDPDDIPIQVVDNQEYKPHPVMQHQHPPPPLLPPPSIVHNPPPFNGLPPPPLFFQRPPPTTQVLPALHPPALLPPPLVPPPVVHIPTPSGPPVTYNSRPPPRQIYFSNGPGRIDYPAVSTVQTSWVPTVVKGTSTPGRSEWTPRRQQEREVDRVRSQNFNLYKPESQRLFNYSRVRSYDYERKRSRERSWEKEERLHGEQRHRDREEESNKHKSSRRKQESEERESNRRHKRKKSKRTKEKSVDNEPTTKANRHDLREKTTSTSRLGSV